MGQLRKLTVVRHVLDLTAEDYQKREERRRRRYDSRVDLKLFSWQRRFTEKLLKCPYCGDTPRLGCIWDPKRGFCYKFYCDFSVNGHDCDMGCGDWYDSLSRAGLSWNYRVLEAQGGPHKHVRHEPLTRRR